jgi:hypothetical protein
LRKYQTWAYLNADGKLLWGEVFPDGEVPILSITAQAASLTGIAGSERVFLVDWTAITSQQQDAILEKLGKRTGGSKDFIIKNILKVGLPLRERLTEGGGMIQSGFSFS